MRAPTPLYKQETMEQLLWRINSCAGLPALIHEPTRRPEKLPKLLAKLSPEQRVLLLELLQGTAWITPIGIFRKKGDLFEVETPTGKYSLTVEACTCPDCKFRGRDCKHVKELRKHGYT